MPRVTLIHPCLGRRAGERRGLRTWQMQPLWVAALAALQPADVELRFYDDRLEAIPFDEPTDLVGLSVETYTARRAYQIASEYRRRGVPVVMGGIHATLCPDEVAHYAECVVTGSADQSWPLLLEDLRAGRMRKHYQAGHAPSLSGWKYDRSIFQGKRYLPIQLIEFGRGCRLSCEFCAVQAAFRNTYSGRPVDDVIAEVADVSKGGRRGLIFFVDDNLACEPERLKEFLRALIPLKVRWVGQAGINVAHDPELLDLIVRSGCRCLLIGFESLQPANLREMSKPINELRGGVERAVAELQRFGVPVYGTFVFGCDGDTPDDFERTVAFSVEHGFLLAAFAHLMPFPGTALYRRLASEQRLLHESWWLDCHYAYNTVAFQPRHLSTDALRGHCLAARRAFFSWPNMLRRSLAAGRKQHDYWTVNLLHRAELGLRDGHPLGDQAWSQPLIQAE
ncbi:radical SAM protein [uncultured Paludibaculum sp.]|uniref:B12-binding domain-containing radical SAM protein n=1 Tax=uncultured Paludibaculum sp. TaxID=1765020 RepID=UPI002AAB8DEE|nr:radical SAM protein [uncultured Paludibaculum sp.]